MGNMIVAKKSPDKYERQYTKANEKEGSKVATFFMEAMDTTVISCHLKGLHNFVTSEEFRSVLTNYEQKQYFAKRLLRMRSNIGSTIKHVLKFVQSQEKSQHTLVTETLEALYHMLLLITGDNATVCSVLVKQGVAECVAEHIASFIHAQYKDPLYTTRSAELGLAFLNNVSVQSRLFKQISKPKIWNHIILYMDPNKFSAEIVITAVVIASNLDPLKKLTKEEFPHCQELCAALDIILTTCYYDCNRSKYCVFLNQQETTTSSSVINVLICIYKLAQHDLYRKDIYDLVCYKTDIFNTLYESKNNKITVVLESIRSSLREHCESVELSENKSLPKFLY